MAVFFIVLGMVIAEIACWIFAGKLVGSGWYVFYWFVVAFFIGLSIVKSNLRHIMPQMQQMQSGGFMQADIQSGKYLSRAIAGMLLLIPGLITDVMALLILLPVVQKSFVRMVMSTLQKRQQAMMNKMMGDMMGNHAQGNPFAEMMRQMQGMNQSANDATIIDGEAREIKPEQKRIENKK